MVYILTIILSTFFFLLASNQKFSDNKKKSYVFILVLITILIPSFIAGIRDISVGTDTRGYLLADYNISLNTSKLNSAINSSNEELGFVTLVFLVTKVFKNFNILMFIIELIITSFVVKFALKSDNKKEAIYIYLFYMILCFGESLCIMRQHISFAILLYTTKLLKEKKYFPTVVLFIIAYSFHSSAICFILIYYLMSLINKNTVLNLKKHYFIILLIFSVCILNINSIINFLINVVHVLPSRYSLYINSSWFYTTGNVNVLTFRFFLDLLFIIVMFICYSFESNEYQKKLNLFSLILLIINLVLYIKSRKFLILSRFSIYFFYGAILLNPLFVKNLNINDKIKLNNNANFKFVLNIVLFILIFATFYGVVILNANNYNLIPFSSIF